MKPARLFDLVGVIFLVAAFGWSAFSVVRHTYQRQESDVVTIHFGHWQLESGLRAAFQVLSDKYMEMHPNVRVIQTPIPGRIYVTWERIGYAGGTLPDLVVPGGGAASLNDEALATNYTPLTEELMKPNPYNKGTPLEGVPWRDTFVDGLSNSLGLGTLHNYYTAATSIMTMRMFYDRRLWKEIFGDQKPPKDYAEFIKDCGQVRDFAKRTGRRIQPIAGSRFGANILLQEFFASETQREALDLDRDHTLNLLNWPNAVTFLPGYATLDDPQVRAGLAIEREMAGYMEPGFLQLDRDDAIFEFGQGRALFLPTGVWDYTSIAEQSPFELGIFPLPYPSRDDPRYGKYTLGPPADYNGVAGGFALAATSKHKDVAIDFLRYMTSVPGAQSFADISKWPSAIIGVKPAPEIIDFVPDTTGYTRGFVISQLMWGFGEVYRLESQDLYRLLAPSGSVDDFLKAFKPDFPAAIKADIGRQVQDSDGSVARCDGELAGMIFLKKTATPEDASRYSAFWQTQNSVEGFSAWLQSELNEMTASQGGAQ